MHGSIAHLCTKRRTVLASAGLAACVVLAGCSSSTADSQDSKSPGTGLPSTGSTPPTSATTSATAPSAPPAPTSSAAPVAARAPISLHVGSDKKVDLPRTLQPGLVHLRNTGDKSLYIYRTLGSGLKAFVRDFNSDTPDGLLRNFDGVDHVVGKTDAYTTLSAGKYFVVYGDAFPIKPEWVSTVEVAGSVSNSTPPANAQSIGIGGDDALSVPASLSPNQPLRITVASPHEQVVYLFPVSSSVSGKAVAKFLAHPGPDGYDALGGKKPVEIAAPAGHETLLTTWRAKPGRYVAVNNAYGANGKLYFDKGQARVVQVR